MPSLSLFDMHCDTAYELYHRKLSLNNRELHISLDKSSVFSPYTQCMAIWSDRRLSDDDAYRDFLLISDNLEKLIKDTDAACLCRTEKEAEAAHIEGKAALILTVEDARILAGDIRRMDVLSEKGVRILTFQWKGKTCIGGGYDTDLPLTPFGRQVLKECFERAIIPDISHACERTAREMIEEAGLSGLSVIATHSDSRAVCRHDRNLSDECYRALIGVGGIAGISLCPEHLSEKGTANAEDVLRHIEHYASLCGIEGICLGCDFDGIEETPTDIRNISELERIAEVMARHNYLESDIRAVFSENAKRFFEKIL